MNSVSNQPTTTPDLFVQPDSGTSITGRWLRLFARLQNIGLFIWITFVTFLPQNIYGLISLTMMLLPVWGLAVVIGLWYLVKAPPQRRLAVWVMVALPIVLTLVIVIHNIIELPIVDSKVGEPLFVTVLLVVPLYRLGRWLIRTTRPDTTDAPPENRGRRNLMDTIFFAVFGMLMLQSLFLVSVMAFADYAAPLKRIFGGDWYTNLLMITLGTTALVAVAGVPYAILRLIRGTPHKAAMIGILAFIVIAIICCGGLLLLFSLLSYG